MEEDLYKSGLSQKLVLKQLKRPSQMGTSLGNARTWELQDDTVLGSKVVQRKPAPIASGDRIKESHGRHRGSEEAFSSQQGTPTEEHSPGRCTRDTQSSEGLTDPEPPKDREPPVRRAPAIPTGAPAALDGPGRRGEQVCVQPVWEGIPAELSSGTAFALAWQEGLQAPQERQGLPLEHQPHEAPGQALWQEALFLR